MDNQDMVVLLDENGNEVQGRIINIVEIDGQEYLLYSVDTNEDEENVFVNKIIKDVNGEDEFVAIEDEEERKCVFDTLKEMIDSIE